MTRWVWVDSIDRHDGPIGGPLLPIYGPKIFGEIECTRHLKLTSPGWRAPPFNKGGLVVAVNVDAGVPADSLLNRFRARECTSRRRVLRKRTAGPGAGDQPRRKEADPEQGDAVPRNPATW